MEWNKLTNTHVKQKNNNNNSIEYTYIDTHTHHNIYNISNQRNKGSDTEIEHEDKNKVLFDWGIENSDGMENLENIKDLVFNLNETIYCGHQNGG